MSFPQAKCCWPRKMQFSFHSSRFSSTSVVPWTNRASFYLADSYTKWLFPCCRFSVIVWRGSSTCNFRRANADNDMSRIRMVRQIINPCCDYRGFASSRCVRHVHFSSLCQKCMCVSLRGWPVSVCSIHLLRQKWKKHRMATRKAKMWRILLSKINGHRCGR